MFNSSRFDNNLLSKEVDQNITFFIIPDPPLLILIILNDKNQ